MPVERADQRIEQMPPSRDADLAFRGFRRKPPENLPRGRQRTNFVGSSCKAHEFVRVRIVVTMIAPLEKSVLVDPAFQEALHVGVHGLLEAWIAGKSGHRV